MRHRFLTVNHVNNKTLLDFFSQYVVPKNNTSKLNIASSLLCQTSPLQQIFGGTARTDNRMTWCNILNSQSAQSMTDEKTYKQTDIKLHFTKIKLMDYRGQTVQGASYFAAKTHYPFKFQALG